MTSRSADHGGEPDDDGAEIGLNGGVQVDGMGPPGWGHPILAGGASPASPPGGRGRDGVLSSAAGGPVDRSVTDPIRSPGGTSNRWPSVHAAPPDRASAPRSSVRARPPARRSPSRRSRAPSTAPRPATLTAEEEARAAEIEARLVAAERSAEEAARPPDPRPPPVVARGARRAPARSPSAPREEYAYVARDVRRIALIGGLDDRAADRDLDRDA